MRIVEIKMEKRKNLLVRPLEHSEKNEKNSKVMAPNIVETIASIKLTELNLDCLESIFNRLPLEDLLNITDTSKQLQLAVRIVYRRHYARKTSSVKLNIQQTIGNKALDERPDHIRIHDMRIALQLLRIFGYFVEELEIRCNENIKQCDKLFRYINEYCSDHLNEINFHRAPEAVATFQKPFSKLDTVTFTNTHLRGEITQFNKWFPRMQTLAFIDDVRLIDSKCLEIHFVSLKALLLSSSIPRESIEIVFQLNAQLRYLHFYCDYPGKLLEMASEYLPNIELLGVLWEKNDNDTLEVLSNMNGNKIHFEKLRTLYLCVEKKEDDQEVQLPRIPITFGPITKLHFYSMCYLGDEFEDFLARHSNITTMLIEGGGYRVENVLETLPFLREITFSNAKFDVAEAVRLMDIFKSLRFVGCPAFKNVTVKNLKSSINQYELHNPEKDESFFKVKRVK